MRDFSSNETPHFPARLLSLFFVVKNRGKRIKTNQQTLEISGIFRFVFIIVYGHSHISLLIDMGFSAVAIADRVGHESIEITYRYAHLFPSKQKEMASKLDDLNKGA